MRKWFTMKMYLLPHKTNIASRLCIFCKAALLCFLISHLLTWRIVFRLFISTRYSLPNFFWTVLPLCCFILSVFSVSASYTNVNLGRFFTSEDILSFQHLANFFQRCHWLLTGEILAEIIAGFLFDSKCFGKRRDFR